MHRFYVDNTSISQKHITISGSDVNHIKNVLRLKNDDVIIVCDKEGFDYECKIKNISKEEVNLEIMNKFATDTELDTKVYLFQGLPKKDKMDLIVQKAVELGVYSVIPVKMNRTIVKIDNEKKEKARISRWQTIASEASKQSRRGIIPKVEFILSFKEALKIASELECVIMPYELAEDMECTRRVVSSIKSAKSIGVFIGPEGGFSEEEINELEYIGGKAITLGKRILRTETAGLATLAMLVFNIEK